MRIEPLIYFLAAAEHGSFSAAARKQFISQQGLCRAIHALEEKLHVKLFERSGRKLRLTKAGRELVPLAKQHVATNDAMTTAMMKYWKSADAPRKMRLYMMPYTVALLYQSSVKAAMDGAYETLILEDDLPNILEKLSGPDAKADLALVNIPTDTLVSLAKTSDLVFTPLFTSELMIRGSRELISPRRTTYRIDEILEMPVSMFKDSVLATLIEKLFSQHRSPNIEAITSILSIRDDDVKRGSSIAFSDTFRAFVSEEDGSLYAHIQDAPSFTVTFICSKSTYGSEEPQEFMRFAADLMNRLYPSYLSKFPTITL